MSDNKLHVKIAWRIINGKKTILYYPIPSNLNYNWSFGSLVGIFFYRNVSSKILSFKKENKSLNSSKHNYIKNCSTDCSIQEHHKVLGHGIFSLLLCTMSGLLAYIFTLSSINETIKSAEIMIFAFFLLTFTVFIFSLLDLK